MRVLVTGATGFVGRHVTDALLERGHEVVALARRRAAPRPGVRPVRGDVATGEGLGEALEGADAVVHLVGIIREGGGDATFEKVHVRGTRNVLGAAREAGAGRYVHMSALGAESGSASAYADSKARAEAVVQGSGLDWTILRPSLIFGVGGEFFGTILRDLVRRPPVVPVVGDGSFPFRPIWAGDVARAFAEALARPGTAGQRYDLVGPAEYTLRELLVLVRDALGSSKPLVGVPLPLIRLALPLLGLLPDPPITRDQFLQLLRGSTGDPEPAREAFGLTLERLETRLPEVLGVAGRAEGGRSGTAAGR